MRNVAKSRRKPPQKAKSAVKKVGKRTVHRAASYPPEVVKWLTDGARGRREAAALITQMRTEENPLLLRAKLATFGDFNKDGVANGFCQEIAERLILAGRGVRAI